MDQLSLLAYLAPNEGMSHLVILRHGHDDDNSLTERGRSESREIAKLIKKHIAPQKVFLACSPVKRAVATAAVLATELNFTSAPVQEKSLSEPFRWEGVREIISEQSSKADAVIFITHLPTFERHLYLFGEYFGFKLKNQEVANSSGVIIDVLASQARFINPKKDWI
jgi:phosphohistidine phosphatase SixA